MPLDPAIAALLADARALVQPAPHRAIPLLERATAAAPEHLPAWRWLAQARERAGDLAGALAAWQRVAAATPDRPQAAYAVAMVLQGLGRQAEARAGLEALVARFPDQGVAWNTLGTVRLAMGELTAAEAAFRRALELDPQSIQARANLAAAQGFRGDTAGAIASLHSAFQAAPEDPVIQVQLGNNLIQRGHLDTAERFFRRALRFAPGDPDALAGLGTCWERAGRAGEARALLDPVVAAGERRANLLAAWALACRRTGDPAGPIPLLEAATGPEAPAMTRSVLGHVLGDLYDKTGDPERALAAHTRANEADERAYDPAAAPRQVDRLVAEATPVALAALPQAPAVAGPRLVFIVGMPRSGTSLTEQILGSHPRVHPAGERDELPRLVESLVGNLAPGGTWLDMARKLDRAGMANAAAWYRERVLAGVGDVDVVTDKLPLNYRYLGLVGRLFPEARVVHCQRDPLDTCLSCFFSNFNHSYVFTTRLDWLGHWYRDYARLMDHWAAAPPLPLLASRYEDLVDDPEPRARALLAFCGLDWDPAVLDFHRSARRVNTASYDQVRRPLYRSSMGRAQAYRPWLGPLLEALGPDLAG